MPVAIAASQSSTVAGKRITLDRLGGAGGLAFAAIVVIQNVIRARAPGFGATPARVSAYFGHHRMPVLVPLGLFPVGMIALCAFVVTIWAKAAGDERRWFADLGVLGTTAIVGLFSVVNISEITLTAKSHELASSMPVVQALWAVHAGAFGLDLAAIAIALLGLSQTAAAYGLIPRPIQLAAMPGAACLLVAATFTVGMANGGKWIALGLVGFLIWIVFVVAASVSLLRGLGGAVEVDS